MNKIPAHFMEIAMEFIIDILINLAIFGAGAALVPQPQKVVAVYAFIKERWNAIF
jgi:hypothetical protein